MKKGVRFSGVLVFVLAAAQPALAATARVSVASGEASISPSPVVLSGGDTRVVFQMATRGFVISGASAPGFTCSVAGDGASATCNATARASRGRIDVDLQVRGTGGERVPAPDIWLQND